MADMTLKEMLNKLIEATNSKALSDDIPEIVQATGDREDAVMSQKAVTDFVKAAMGDGSAYETVDSIEEMTDTNKSYILSTTGTLWSWLPVEVEITTDKEEPIVSTTGNLAVNNARLTSTKSADYVSTGATGYVTSPYVFLDQWLTHGEITLKLGGGKQWIFPKSSDAPSYCRVLMTDANNDSIKLISNAALASTWADDSLKTTTFDGTDTYIKLTLPYINTSKEVARLRFSTQGDAWADGDISVIYTVTETDIGDPQWVDTGIVVADITEFALVNSDVKEFEDEVTYTDGDYTTSAVETYAQAAHWRKDRPNPVLLKWNADLQAVEYSVSISTSSNISVASSARYTTSDTKIAIYNLLPGTTYYYRVDALCANATEKIIKTGSFTTTANRTRMIAVDGIQNVRDVGGYTGADDKTVRYGLIYRGSAMDEAASDNLYVTDAGRQEMLVRLGIHTDVDLRAGYSQSPLNSNARTVDEPDVDYINTSSGYENYATALTTPSQRTNFASLFASIVTQLQAGKPIYIHCQGGNDRTGTMIFLLLGLLGVSENDLAKEYELSSFSSIGRYRKRNNGKYDAMITQLGSYDGTTIADKVYSFATKATDDTTTGGCGIATATIEAFRTLMLA